MKLVQTQEVAVQQPAECRLTQPDFEAMNPVPPLP